MTQREALQRIREVGEMDQCRRKLGGPSRYEEMLDIALAALAQPAPTQDTALGEQRCGKCAEISRLAHAVRALHPTYGYSLPMCVEELLAAIGCRSLAATPAEAPANPGAVAMAPAPAAEGEEKL